MHLSAMHACFEKLSFYFISVLSLEIKVISDAKRKSFLFFSSPELKRRVSSSSFGIELCCAVAASEYRTGVKLKRLQD